MSPGTSRTELDGTATEGGSEVRCECGALIAVRTPRGLEVKCRRCRRRIVLIDPRNNIALPDDGECGCGNE